MMLNDFILKTAESSFELQNDDGSFPAGHNGPYHDPETPVRNSSHWLIIFAKCFKLTSKSKFKNKVLELAEYLYSKDARPYGYSFYHRKKKTKDKCNGLIGQAWTFEALAEAAKTLDDYKYIQLAEDVFFQHPFNEELGLWNCLEIDGQVLPIDSTFNHQLWFAACISLIRTKKEVEIKKRISRFLDCLPKNLTVLENGLVCHPVENLLEGQLTRGFTFKAKIKKTAKKFLDALKNKKENLRNMIYKSVGYHAFNMYAFALLKQQIPNHTFWNSTSFKKAIEYMLTEEYKLGLNDNYYGYPYNPPGFEVPYSLNILKNINEKELTEISQWWINEQFKRAYNKKTERMDKNTTDPDTLTARIYEATRLPNIKINI